MHRRVCTDKKTFFVMVAIFSGTEPFEYVSMVLNIAKIFL